MSPSTAPLRRLVTAMATTAVPLRTLVVGDGNFSFCLALLAAGGCLPAQLTATSYDPYELLITKYGEPCSETVSELRRVGCRVVHGVDAMRLGDFQCELGIEEDFSGYDRIVFNNPLIEGREKVSKEVRDGADYTIQNRYLILAFLRTALPFLAACGEIHVTVKDTAPYSFWRVDRLALHAPPLTLLRRDVFDPAAYPGFVAANVESGLINRRALQKGQAHGFPVDHASTFVFGVPRSAEGEPAAAAGLAGDCAGAAAHAAAGVDEAAAAAGDNAEPALSAADRDRQRVVGFGIRRVPP